MAIRARLVAVVLALTGCGTDDGGTASRESTQASVVTAEVAGLGEVLADAGTGRTLYLFLPDAQGAPTCTEGCLVTWPALVATAGQPTAGGAARPELVGVTQDSGGQQQVTYNGWPLYRFVGDVEPRQATGHGLDLDGGLWFALTPRGDAVAAAAAPR